MLPAKIYAFLISLFVFCDALSLKAQDINPPSYTVIEDQAKIPILTPSFAERKTLKIRLANGLEAYLISDPKADKSAALLIVKAGSWEDPKEYPGIAHFLEHMLFMGTKKYPKEGEYDSFISEHGGVSNAYTADTYTAYMFSVNNDAFPEALDRFSNFFKEPLFNPSGVSRELHAIDQEYAKNVEEDSFREFYVYKAQADPEHPQHAFGMGNSSALAKVSQETLKKWYHEHYSANLMRLIISSPLPIEEIKALAVADFQGVPNLGKKEFHNPIPLTYPNLEGRIVYIEPIKNIRSLSLSWNLPSQFTDMKESRPDSLVCFALGHEGEKSLLAELKRENLAESLTCGANQTSPDNMDFSIEIGLTTTGVQQVYQVIHRIFQALAILKQKGVPVYIYDEVEKMAKIHYQYQQRKDAFSQMLDQARWIAYEDLKTYPEQTLLIKKFDPQAIQALLNYLTPQHCQIFLQAPSDLTHVPLDLKEPWLGASYAIRPVPKETLAQWERAVNNPHIDLPDPNSFIPKQLNLVQNNQGNPSEQSLIPHPHLIFNTSLGKIYYAPDFKFGVPEISWYFEIKTPQINAQDPSLAALAELYVKSLKEALNKFTYDASMAGLNYAIERKEDGMRLHIYGYNENAPRLFERILQEIKALNVSEASYKTYKETLLRNYLNAARDSPLTQSVEVFKSFLYQRFSTQKQLAAAIRKITFEKFKAYLASVFKQVYVEGIMYGNMTQEQADQIVTKLVATLDATPSVEESKRKPEIIVLPEKDGPFYLDSKTKSEGNATLLVIENSDFSFKKRAAQQILLQAMQQPFFSSLRTQQQTGYLVFSNAEEIQKQLFSYFAVQSNTHDPRDLLARFEEFIEGYLQEIKIGSLSEGSFNVIKQALLITLQQPPKNLVEMSELLNKLAFEYNADFDWIDKRVQGMNELTYAEFLTFVYEILGHQNKRRVAVLMRGEAPDDFFEYKRMPNVEKLRQLSTYISL